MTKQRDLKKQIRARMEQTGESYMTARMALMKSPDSLEAQLINESESIPEVTVDPSRSTSCQFCGKPEQFGYRARESEGFDWSCGEVACMVKTRKTNEETRSIDAMAKAFAQPLLQPILNAAAAQRETIDTLMAKNMRAADPGLCDTPYDECVLPRGHRSDEHGDDHQRSDGVWWNIGQTIARDDVEYLKKDGWLSGGELELKYAKYRALSLEEVNARLAAFKMDADTGLPRDDEPRGDVNYGNSTFSDVTKAQAEKLAEWTELSRAKARLELAQEHERDAARLSAALGASRVVPGVGDAGGLVERAAGQKPNATAMMKKAIESWGITIAPDGKLTAADGRVLKARWSPESSADTVADLRAFTGLDGELELARAVLDTIFMSLMEQDPPKPTTEVVSEKFNVKVNPFERELMSMASEMLPRMPKDPNAIALHNAPTPAQLRNLDEETARRYMEVSGGPVDLTVKPEDGCTCGPAIGSNPHCPFHHAPVIETSPTAGDIPTVIPAKPDVSIDVAKQLVEKAIADHSAGGVRGVVTVDLGNQTPEEATKTLTAMKAQYRVALGKPPLDHNGRCALCHVVPDKCQCLPKAPPIVHNGMCVCCGRLPHVCDCAPDPVGTKYARCPTSEKGCGQVYRLFPTKSRTCEHCGHNPIEVILVSGTTRCSIPSSVTGQACLLAEGHPAFSPLRFHCYRAPEDLFDSKHRDERIEHATKREEALKWVKKSPEELRGRRKVGVMIDDANFMTPEQEMLNTASADVEALAGLPPIPVSDLAPMLETLKYINSGDAHPKEAQAEAREVLENFDKKYPKVLTALMDPEDDEDADELDVALAKASPCPPITVVVVNGEQKNVAPTLGSKVPYWEDETQRLQHEKSNARFLSYREVVTLAGFDPERVLSVTYWVKNGPQGTLSPGKQTEVWPGMVFNVADTSSA